MALINPDNPDELCAKLYQDTGIPVVLMDANDLQRDQLGKSPDFPLTDAQIQDAMADNPSGQGDELTPLHSDPAAELSESAARPPGRAIFNPMLLKGRNYR